MKHLIVILLLALVGCTATPQGPPTEENVIVGEVDVETVPFISWDRECGEPGDGWMPFGEGLQPPHCDQYYYMIDGDKGLVCGPPDCASSYELMAMYRHLIGLILAQGTTMQEG